MKTSLFRFQILPGSFCQEAARIISGKLASEAEQMLIPRGGEREAARTGGRDASGDGPGSIVCPSRCAPEGWLLLPRLQGPSTQSFTSVHTAEGFLEAVDKRQAACWPCLCARVCVLFVCVCARVLCVLPQKFGRNKPVKVERAESLPPPHVKL